MKFNKSQITHMILLGMSQNATEAEQIKFFNTLAAELQNQVLAMATVESPAAVATGTAAQPKAEDKPAQPTAPGAQFAEQVQTEVAKALKQETDRQLAAHQIGKRFNLGEDWIKEQISGNVTLEQMNKSALEKIEKLRQPVAGVRVGEDLNASTIGAAMSDALLMRAGVALVETDGDGRVVKDSSGKPKSRQPHDRARQFGGLRASEMVRSYMQAIGIDAFGMSPAQVCQLGFNRKEMNRRAGGIFQVHSTSDFDSILLDSIGKTLRAAFVELSPTWMRWAREASTPDFKTISRVQLSGIGTPPAVPEGMEYTYATKSDGKEQYTVVKYGQIFQITWEALVNDDLSAFSRIPRSHALSCARLEDDIAYGILNANAAMADGVALFHATHANLGAGAVISVTSLGAMRTLMRLQTGMVDEPLDIMPVHLIVPVTQEVLAKQVISSTVDPAKSNATPNPFNNDLQITANPRLDATSTTAWYIAASPDQTDTIEICFLEGMRQPQLSEELGFDVDARKYKVKHVVGGKAIDHRGLAKNPGA